MAEGGVDGGLSLQQKELTSSVGEVVKSGRLLAREISNVFGRKEVKENFATKIVVEPIPIEIDGAGVKNFMRRFVPGGDLLLDDFDVKSEVENIRRAIKENNGSSYETVSIINLGRMLKFFVQEMKVDGVRLKRLVEGESPEITKDGMEVSKKIESVVSLDISGNNKDQISTLLDTYEQFIESMRGLVKMDNLGEKGKRIQDNVWGEVYRPVSNQKK